ncbi:MULTISPECIES: ATP-binding protein [Anaerolinea]|uniref:helicase HerA domain-containing protein n=1 Tax=Anaerolinea TaxID=233189 RepID=UPI0026150EB9|nr:ATP-binding protein [Anaerolinea thermophila]
MPSENPAIGYIVGGNLKTAVRARLTVPTRDVQEGAFVVIEDGDFKFYGSVTDIQLGSTNERFADEQSEQRLPADLAKLLHGQTLYTTLEIMLSQMVHSPEGLTQPLFSGPVPVKTIPSHHATVRLAGEGDFAEIFGDPHAPGNLVIGYNREQGHPIPVKLGELVKRSSGVFGATGTGKSFLTRIVLAGIIQHDVAASLIFDMHNEYGPNGIDSDRNQAVPGLRQKFPAKVRLVGLGKTTLINGMQVDFSLEIGEEDIQPGDIEMLTRELNLKETTPATLSALEHQFGKKWFSAFKNMEVGTKIEGEDGKPIPAPNSVEYWAREAGVNEMAAVALHSKLQRVFRLPYIVPKPAADPLNALLEHLEKGHHIVLSFGEYDRDLDYLLVTNILTRRIREAWQEKTDTYRASPQTTKQPRQLLIVVEEAHKLLSREMASQTIFSTIARELRKYYVTLLIVDQRPSQIDDEVMSQLGTRICGWLGDDSDIQAVLSGLPGKDALRGFLSRLQPKEEAMMMGWGIATPIPFRTRKYDEHFWKDLQGDRFKKQSESDLIKALGIRDSD